MGDMETNVLSIEEKERCWKVHLYIQTERITQSIMKPICALEWEVNIPIAASMKYEFGIITPCHTQNSSCKEAQN
jgi:hypothetical protein